jgi:O-antigen/teichoic acid export membrane protein
VTAPEGSTGQGEPQRHETAAERSDRNWDELLQELRVTQTGIQILSGFLLTLPFQARFARLDPTQRGLYLLAVCLSTLATGLVVAPVSSHRLLFRRHEKSELVTISDRIAKSGLIVLALTVITVMALIFSFVVGSGAAAAAALLVSCFFAGAWVILPLSVLRRRRPGRQRGVDPPL